MAKKKKTITVEHGSTKSGRRYIHVNGELLVGPVLELENDGTVSVQNLTLTGFPDVDTAAETVVRLLEDQE